MSKRFGETNSNWRGGMPRCNICNILLRTRNAKTCLEHRPKRGRNKSVHNGYVIIYKPDHPYAGNNGYVKEHRLVMEKHIGRILGREEVIHHINHDKKDNRIENLTVITSHEHAKHHHAGAKRSDETKDKIRKASLGNKRWLGKKHTWETRQKMSLARKAYWESRSQK